MKKYILTPLLLIALTALVRWSFYTVDAAEYAYVTVLGEHRVTYDGSDRDKGAGLKFGWPWPIQQVQRLDRRLQQFDLPPVDQLTHDPDGNTIDKILSIEAYVCWKIDPKSVDQFVKRIGSADRARGILAPLIISQLGAEIGQKRMDDIVSVSLVDPALRETRADLTARELRDLLLQKLKGPVGSEFGIELVDIRLRRFNHPLNVRDSIFNRIRSERRKEAAKYESEGEREASKILTDADADYREKIAAARSREERIKADADVEANKIRNEAYSQDREFYKFVKSMESLQSIVGGEKSMLLLSTHRPLFEALFNPPRQGEKKSGAEKK